MVKKGSQGVKDYLALAQLKSNLVLPLGISRSAFYRAVEALPSSKTKRAPSGIMHDLKDCQALLGKTSVCDLVSLSTAAHLLKTLKVPSLVVESLLLKHEVVIVSESTSDMEDASSESGDDITPTPDFELQDEEEFGEEEEEEDTPEEEEEEDPEEQHDSEEQEPSEQESDGVTEQDYNAAMVAAQLQARYGLTSIKDKRERAACLSTISLDMDSLQAWSQATFQPGRPKDMRQMGTTSWQTHKQRVHEYLGYLYHYQGIKRPTMRDYLHQQHFSGFMSFIKERGLDKAGHIKAVAAAVRVVAWLNCQPQSSENKAQGKLILKWLKDMGAQLSLNLVPKPKSREPENLKSQGKWMDAPELVARVEAVRLEALKLVADMEGERATPVAAAKGVHNALLATMCFGYMPPIRDNSLLLTITHPPFVGCTHQDCQHRHTGCTGNRVFKHNGAWVLEAPHHKTSRSWQGKAIKVKLPSEVAELLQHHIDWGKAILTSMHEQVAPTLFVNTSTGAPLKPQEVAKVWSNTVLQGTGIKFGPQMCRSIFVVGTRDRGLPESPGLAMVMGNSQAVWDSVYDRHFNTRQVQEAMDGMPAWRERMLSDFASQASTF